MLTALLSLSACTPKLFAHDQQDEDSAAPADAGDTEPTDEETIAVTIESPEDGATFWEAQAPYVVVRVESPDHDDLGALDLTWTGAAEGYEDVPDTLSAKGEISFLLPDLAVGEHTVGLVVSDRAGASGSDQVAFEVVPRDVDGDGHVDDNFDGDDCDDDDDTVYAGAKELCDGVDNDCDERVDEGCDTGDTG